MSRPQLQRDRKIVLKGPHLGDERRRKSGKPVENRHRDAEGNKGLGGQVETVRLFI